MALTAEQIKMLEGMEGIDQSLVSGYKRNNSTPTLNAPTQTAADVVTTSEANPDLTGPQKAADTGGVDQQSDFTNFTVAVNKGIDMARQQRQDMALDTVGGMAPAGALPASSFASVIDQFNRSAAPIQSELIGAALDERQNDKERKLTVENQIRELSMSVASETGDTKVAQMILAELNKPNPDLDAAINMSLIPLGSEYVRTQNGIAKKGKDDSEEDSTVFEYDPASQTMPGGVTRKLFTGREDSLREIPYVDYTKTSMDIDLVRADTRKYLGSISETIKSSLNNNLERDFITDWIDLTTATEQYQEPAEYFKTWMKTRGLEIVPPKEKKDDSKKDEEEENDDFDALLEDAWAPSDPND